MLPAKPLVVDPDPALERLLEAIRKGGREAYRRLLEVLRELRRLECGTAMLKQALAELSRAQGVVLGNVGVYLDASVDPETLTHSKAALAQALVRQGLVHQAMRCGGDGLPLLRGIVAQTLAGVAGEEQVLVFAERVWCLRQLAHTLRERHGFEAHVADGQVKRAEFEELKESFNAGEYPVLCLSRIGQEGHNLQRRERSRTSICHGFQPGWSSVSDGPRDQVLGTPASRRISHTCAGPPLNMSSRCSHPAAASITRSSTASKGSPPATQPSRPS